MLNVGRSNSGPFRIKTDLIATGKTCVIGASGSGKSSVVTVLCEELCKEKVPFAIIDVEGEYRGLKKKYKAIWIGDARDCDIPWKDVKIESLANLMAEAPPLILDFSGAAHPRERAEAFLREIWRSSNKLRVPYLIIIDEADVIIPNAGEKVKVATDIAVRGRKRGLGLLICMERPSLVSGNVLSQCTNQIIGKLVRPDDLQAVKPYGVDSEQLDQLKEKGPGFFWVLGDISPKRTLVKFRKRKTPDLSETPTLLKGRMVRAPEEIIQKIKRRSQLSRPRKARFKSTETMSVDSTLLSKIRTVAARSKKTFSDDRNRITFLIEKSLEAVPVELGNAKSGKTYAEMLLRGLENHLPIRTMWTIDFGDEMLKRYIRAVLPKEQQAIRNSLVIRRIVGHLDVRNTLRYIALHSRTFAHKTDVTFTLYLPKINPKPSNLQEILLSGQLCPKVEIVVIGDEEASLDVPSIGGMARVHSHTTESKLVQNAYQHLFEWFCRNGTAITNKGGLLEWIGQLESALEFLASRPKSAQEKSAFDHSHKRINSLIEAIRRACEPDESLSAAWWDGTAPIYTPKFTSSGDPFLEAYLEEESTAIHRVLDKIKKDSKKAPVYLEVGCGAGRVFKNLISKRSNYEPPPIAAMIGVDFSREMLVQCKMTLETESQRNHGTGVWPVPWVLIQGDALRFDELVGGKPRALIRDPLFSGKDGDKVRNVLDNPWVVGLTSILPNLGVDDQQKLFKSVSASLRPGDVLFASTYKAEHFKKVAYDLYNMADVVTKISGETVITYDEKESTYCSLDEQNGRYFYSHWLSKNELMSLFQRNGPWNTTVLQFEKPRRVAQREANDPKLQDTPYPRGTFIFATKLS